MECTECERGLTDKDRYFKHSSDDGRICETCCSSFLVTTYFVAGYFWGTDGEIEEFNEYNTEEKGEE